jgi:hypothetical protein
MAYYYPDARIFVVFTAVKIQTDVFWVVRCRVGLWEDTNVSEGQTAANVRM